MVALQRSTSAPCADGPIDPGIEQRHEPVGAEAAAHALLRLIVDHPGQMGRLRASRIIGGYAVPHRDGDEPADYARYVVHLDWPLREITALVDSLISGRMMAQTAGPRPVLVLTRAGFRTLEALEGGLP